MSVLVMAVDVVVDVVDVDDNVCNGCSVVFVTLLRGDGVDGAVVSMVLSVGCRRARCVFG